MKIFNNPVLTTSQIHKDSRGYFTELYNFKNKNFKNITFVQDNLSYSKKGILRGLHFQLRNPQLKFITVIYGKIFDVAVDLRNNSKNFGRVYSFEMSFKNKNQLLIPRGFAHGFQCVSEYALIHYKCDNYYFSNDQHGIIENDLSFKIKWPIKKKIISKKDSKLPNFNKHKIYFK